MHTNTQKQNRFSRQKSSAKSKTRKKQNLIPPHHHLPQDLQQDLPKIYHALDLFEPTLMIFTSLSHTTSPLFMSVSVSKKK